MSERAGTGLDGAGVAVAARQRVAVVSGAASGIGRATAAAFAASGASVVAVDIDAAALARVAAAWPGLRTEVVDLRSPNEVAALGRDLPDRVDALANVAGLYLRAGLAGFDADRSTAVLGANVVGPSLLTAAVVEKLAASGGCVVNVSSATAGRASATAPTYAASKAAVEHLTRVWSLELAPHGVRVNAVAPGPVHTAVLARAGLTPAEIARQRDAERERTPLRRLGEAEEIARWILLLCDPTTTVTGQVLGVDGGLACA